VRDYVLTLLVTAAVTYMLTPLVRRLARRIGAIKEPRDRDVHTSAVPTIGGLAMYGGLAAGLLVADQIKNLRDGFANTGMISGLLLAGGLLVAIGVIDDRWGLSPLMKAAGQVAAGGILVATGTQLNWIPLPGGQTFLPTPPQATVLTILIVVATINAVNFIDGLDGLAAGIVAIAAVSFFLYYYSMTKVIDISSLAAPALASAVLIGMCLGFLPHNFSPASIFMGDTGSMLLGLLLAYAPISSLPSLDPAVLASHINRYPVILPLLLPAALLVIPYADLLLAVVRRTRAGQSPFAPDRKHLHHRLLDIGHSQRASVLIMYLWAAVFSGSVVWLSLQRTQQPGGPNTNHHGHPVVVFIAITFGAVVVLLLMSLPMLRQWGRGTRPEEALAQPENLPVADLEPGVAATAEFDQVLASAAKLQPPAAAPVAAASSAEPQLVAAAAMPRMTPPGISRPNRPTATRDWADSGWTDSAWPRRDWTTRDWAGHDWTDPDLTNPDWGRHGEAAALQSELTATGLETSDSRVGDAGVNNSAGRHSAGNHAARSDPSSVWPVGTTGVGSTGDMSGQADASRAEARSIIGTPPPPVDPTKTTHGGAPPVNPPKALGIGPPAAPVVDWRETEREETGADEV